MSTGTIGAPLRPMSSQETIAVLNRVLAIVCRSFPQYLRYAHPYTRAKYAKIKETLDEIGADQDSLIERITQLVDREEGHPDTGEFPMEFTSSHDLGSDYLIREAIQYHRQDIAALDQCSTAADVDVIAQPLIEEALTSARKHLTLLEKLATETAPSTIVNNGAPAYQND